MKEVLNDHIKENQFQNSFSAIDRNGEYKGLSALPPNPDFIELQRMADDRFIRLKLDISVPGDPAELEADRVSEEVLRIPDDIQKKDSEEEEPEVTRPYFTIGRKAFTGSISGENNEASIGINNLTGGAPLNERERSYFEPRFGVDFGNVKIHTGGKADAMAKSIHARAFTKGSDIVFAKGEYRPDTWEGKTLLAHELTHVIQQDNPSGKIVSRREQILQRPPGLTVSRGNESKIMREDGGSGTPAQKTVTVNITHMHDSSGNAAGDLNYASTKVYNQANVKIQKGTEITVNETDSKAVLGNDLILDEFTNPKNPTDEEKALFKLNQKAGVITVYYVKGLSMGNLGEAFWPALGHSLVGAVCTGSYITDFAHELGHILLDDGGHNVPDKDSDTYLMYPYSNSKRYKLTNTEIAKIRSSPYAK
ncbi:MAG: DUF4157 domain-containing protein [bacterium]